MTVCIFYNKIIVITCIIITFPLTIPQIKTIEEFQNHFLIWYLPLIPVNSQTSGISCPSQSSHYQTIKVFRMFSEKYCTVNIG